MEPTEIILTMEVTKDIPEGYVLLHNIKNSNLKMVIKREYYQMITDSVEQTMALGEHIDKS